MTAYALFVLAGLHACDAALSRASDALRGALWLLTAITLQGALGILTLLNDVPIALALSHQAVAIVVLTLAVLQVERMSGKRTEFGARGVSAPLTQPG
jgi:cytochrome c oxidase assembly protein subunit 15